MGSGPAGYVRSHLELGGIPVKWDVKCRAGPVKRAELKARDGG